MSGQTNNNLVPFYSIHANFLEQIKEIIMKSDIYFKEYIIYFKEYILITFSKPQKYCINIKKQTRTVLSCVKISLNYADFVDGRNR